MHWSSWLLSRETAHECVLADWSSRTSPDGRLRAIGSRVSRGDQLRTVDVFHLRGIAEVGLANALIALMTIPAATIAGDLQTAAPWGYRGRSSSRHEALPECGVSTVRSAHRSTVA